MIHEWWVEDGNFVPRIQIIFSKESSTTMPRAVILKLTTITSEPAETPLSPTRDDSSSITSDVSDASTEYNVSPTRPSVEY